MARRTEEDLTNVRMTFVDSVDDIVACKQWVGERRDRFAFDCETTGVNLGRDRVRTWQIGDRDHGWVFPVEGSTNWYGAFVEVMRAAADTRVPMYAHNLIFDYSFLKRDGYEFPRWLCHDTMVMAQLADSSKPAGLKPTASRLVNRRAVAAEKMKSEAEKKQGWNWATVPVDFPWYWQYAALDPVFTCRIAEHLEPKVFARYRDAYEIEIAAIHTLSNAELAGMRVDVPYCVSKSKELEAEMQALMPELPCNPNSPPQVIKYLQDNGARLVKRTESGTNWAVDDEVLKYWEEKIPACAAIRRFRECKKIKGSYLDKMVDLQTDDIVHPSIRVLGAEKTGRMSVTDPALQTLPKSKIGRDPFIAREGCTLISADFSGIEMRLLAHLANEEVMIQKYLEGVDLHGWTAEEIYHVTPPLKSQRNVAKRSGFAKIYGAGIPKFALSCGLSESEAADFLARYDQLFPAVAKFQQDQIKRVQESRPTDKRYGEVHTLAGRRLMVPKDDAHTKAVNYTDQGSAGEILKRKLAELDAAGLGPYIRLPIHDEIIFEVPDEQLDEAKHIIAEVMPDRTSYAVPLEIEMESAVRWGDLYDE